MKKDWLKSVCYSMCSTSASLTRKLRDRRGRVGFRETITDWKNTPYLIMLINFDFRNEQDFCAWLSE